MTIVTMVSYTCCFAVRLCGSSVYNIISIMSIGISFARKLMLNWMRLGVRLKCILCNTYSKNMYWSVVSVIVIVDSRWWRNVQWSVVSVIVIVDSRWWRNVQWSVVSVIVIVDSRWWRNVQFCHEFVEHLEQIISIECFDVVSWATGRHLTCIETCYTGYQKEWSNAGQVEVGGGSNRSPLPSILT